MTPDQRKTCERIATAMGFSEIADGQWKRQGWSVCDLPNFFADPDAADALMRWLLDARYRVMVDTYYPAFGKAYAVTVSKDDTCGSTRITNPDWKTALALAADKAIQEAT